MPTWAVSQGRAHTRRPTVLPHGSSFVAPLDAYTANLQFARSDARRLLSSYTGPLMRVRRSSDDTELDIGHTVAGDLDQVALLAFCGAGNGFIVNRYDQTSHAVFQTQPIALLQPKIVAGGVVLALNGQPAANYNIASVGSIWVTATGNQAMKQLQLVASAQDATFDEFDALYNSFALGDLLLGESGTARFFDFSVLDWGGSVLNYWLNGVDKLATRDAPMLSALQTIMLSSSVGSTGQWTIGIDHDGGAGRPWRGWCPEDIGYSVVNLTIAAAVEANQRAYFNT